MEGFWARLCAGRLDDGTAGVQPVILYGAAMFAATGRGRRSAPTTAMRKACVTACGAAWVRDASEHRSTKCCSSCGCVLDKVWAPTPERVYDAAAAKAQRELPEGWARAPARAVAPWSVVRGMLRCDTDECRARSLRHRDGDACRLILANALAEDAAVQRGGAAADGTLPCMRGGRHADDPARDRVFDLHRP